MPYHDRGVRFVLTAEQRKTMAEMVEQGASSIDVAQRLGISHQSAAQHITNLTRKPPQAAEPQGEPRKCLGPDCGKTFRAVEPPAKRRLCPSCTESVRGIAG